MGACLSRLGACLSRAGGSEGGVEAVGDGVVQGEGLALGPRGGATGGAEAGASRGWCEGLRQSPEPFGLYVVEGGGAEALAPAGYGVGVFVGPGLAQVPGGLMIDR